MNTISNKSIRQYSRAHTSDIIFVYNETHQLCVEITVENDSNEENNFACKTYDFLQEIIEEDEEEEEEDCNIELMNPELFENKATIDFDVENNNEEYEVTYWVEDLFENIIKKKTTTSNDNKKQFTPQNSGVYILKIEFEGCKQINKETFFAVKKNEEEKLITEIKKTDPLEIFIETTSTKYVKDGTIISINEDLNIITDLLKGKQEFTIINKQLCGNKEITITSDELEDSYAIATKECEKKEEEKEITPEISAIIVNNTLIGTVFSPTTEDIELYIRQNKKKIGITKYHTTKGIIQEKWVLTKEGKYEFIAKINKKVYSKYLEHEKETMPQAMQEQSLNTQNAASNVPLITGKSIGTNNANNKIIYLLIGVIIFLIYDKFLKNKKRKKT